MYSEIDYWKKYMAGTWFYPWAVDRIEADLNTSLRSIVRKDQGDLENDGKSPEYITREKYAIWLESQHFD